MKEFFIKTINLRTNGVVTVSVPANKATFDSQLTKFEKEAERLSKIHNDHIVRVYDLFKENGTVYYTMDYIDGESLAERMKRTKKPLSEKEVRDILEQVLDALGAVHRQGIYHLDLKPGNIMLDTQGKAYLIDFGASKQISQDENDSHTSTMICHSPGYAPTEQVAQNMGQIGAWTDIYALGATLYNLLTNISPSKINVGEPPQYTKPVSPQMQELISWMMQPNRTKRPQSVADIRRFLTPKSEVETSPVEPDGGDITILGGEKKTEDKPVTTPINWQLLLMLAIVGLFAVGIFVLAQCGGQKTNSIVDIEAVDSIEDVYSAAVVPQKHIEVMRQILRERTFQYESAIGPCTYTGDTDASGYTDDVGLPSGRGRAVFSDGRLYEGPFIHGVMEGENARFVYENGDVFEGEFRDNKFYVGKYTIKSDGSYFVGTFKDGQPDKGTWYNKNGKIIEG